MMRAPSTTIKATVFLGMAALLVAGCASKKSSNTAAASSAPPATSAAAPADTSAAAPASSGAAGLAPAATSAAASSAAGGSTGPATVATKMGPLGAYLTDASGRTLYMYTSDTSPTSTCYGQCNMIWPALLTNGAPQAGTGATPTFLGTSPRTDGSNQVTYKGHPLYYFSGDKAAGDMSGEGKFGIWYLVSPTGAQIGAAKAAPAPTKAAPTKAAPTTAAPAKAGTPTPTKAAPTTAAPAPTTSAAAGGWA